MRFDLFLSYDAGPSYEVDDKLKDYYKTEEEYAEALNNEERSTGSLVFNAMSRGELDVNTYYGRLSGRYKGDGAKENLRWAKCVCSLHSPRGTQPETVDSIIDKFAQQKEFLVMANIDSKDTDAEFEEELKEWAKVTWNILTVAKKEHHSGEWIDRHVPKREMRMKFTNKSGKEVSFIMDACEIEDKIAKNRYIFYVKRLRLLK